MNLAVFLLAVISNNTLCFLSPFIIRDDHVLIYSGPKVGLEEHSKSSGTVAMMKAFKKEGILAGKPVLQFCDGEFVSEL